MNYRDIAVQSIHNVIEYCREIEKARKGKGVETLKEIMAYGGGGNATEEMILAVEKFDQEYTLTIKKKNNEKQ